MCPYSDIATKISLGKTKCQYMILYGLAPYYKNELIKRIDDIYYSLSFDEALTSVIQKCQMDLHIKYWDSTERTVTLIHNTLRDQMLIICLIVYMWVQQS